MEVSSSIVLVATIVECVIGAVFLLLLLVSLNSFFGTLLRFCCFDDEESKVTGAHTWLYITYVSIISFIVLRLLDSTFTVVMSIYKPDTRLFQNIVTAIQMAIIPGNTWLLICVIFLSLSVTSHLMDTGAKKLILWGIFALFSLIAMMFSILAMASSVLFEALKGIFSSGNTARVFSDGHAWVVTTTIALPIHLAVNTLLTLMGIGFAIYVYHNRLDSSRANKRMSTHPLQGSFFASEKKERKRFNIMMWIIAFVEFSFLVGIVLKVIPDVLLGFSESQNIPRYVINIFLRCTSEAIPIGFMLTLLWPYSVHETCIPVVATMIHSQRKKAANKSAYVLSSPQSAYINSSSTDTHELELHDGTSVETPAHWRTLYDLYSDNVDVNSV